MSTLRWYIKTYKYSTWDDRVDTWRHHSTSSTPVLQVEIGNNNWVDIPIYESIKDERVLEDEDRNSDIITTSDLENFNNMAYPITTRN